MSVGDPREPAKADATAMAAETLYRERRLSVNAIAEKLHISKSTPFTGSSGERLTGLRS